MLTLSAVLPSKHADSTAAMIEKLMKQIPAIARKTLTFDNGGEFAKHESLKQSLSMDIFFCKPYASWQKGGVENTNGRLRRYLPRSTNVKELSQHTFDDILNHHNNTPRKKLRWLTPLQSFEKNLRRCCTSD